MDFLLGIASSLVGKIIELTIKPVCRPVGYIFNYKSNIASLETEVNNLSVLKTGMRQKADQALNNVEKISADVDDWMSRADHVIEEVEKILKDDEGHAKAKCSFQSFPNLVRRHGLSRKATKMAASIASLRTEIPRGSISYSQVLPSSDEVIEGYEAFESRNLIMNQMIDALRNPEVQVVGLYGMGGIGKTMLAKEVSRRARLDKIFEIDVMVTVSNDPKPQDIQQHIAERLCLTLNDKTVSERANKLRLRLTKEKNILIILDDVWKELNLQEIGVSFKTDQKGCKILVTSRFANVCDFIKAKKSTPFNLQDLNHSEARQLFNQNVGDSTREFDFEILANEIIKECAGLPIAIVVVASALKNGREEVWKDVLRELKSSSPTNIKGMDEKVYSSIKLSYKWLANEEAKNLLLLCSLHAEDKNILIEDLVKYGMGLSWFHHTTKLEEARNRVHNLVDTLKERSLLLDGKNEGLVKLHDVIRDVCLSIASLDKGMHFIRDIDHLEECIQKEKLVEEATGISLPIEAINHLPQKLKWPHLKLLLLQEEETDEEILDEQCFEEMKDLRVLSLSYILVNQTCFSSLQKLQTLCLRSCVLRDIAPIGELNKLKILDLSKSHIFKLPKKVGQLTQLQLLDLNFCEILCYVESQVLSNLKTLEQLEMMSSSNKWGVEGVYSKGHASLVEVNDLNKLTTLYINVPNVNSLPKFWLSNQMKLERYIIRIGLGHYNAFDYNYSTETCKTPKMLALKLVKSHQVKGSGLERFIGNAKTLHLEGFVDLNDVLELDNKGFQHVEHFLFKCNKGARYFINPPNPCRAFLSLKSLVLYQMMNLEKICHGKLKLESFGKLEKVKVLDCQRLKSLFSFSIARQFEKIEVWGCLKLQEIGTRENEHEFQNAINDSMNETKSCKLETLRLLELPKLTRFFWPEQETNYTSDRGEGLFNSKVVFTKLREMELSRIEVEKLWPDELRKASFMKNLTTLKVIKCSGLNYLSSFDVAKSLKLLESLELSDLEALKVVIVVKKQMDEVERMEKKLFPKLHTLQLKNLQNMDKFCSQCCFEFPSLKVLRINECPKVADLDLIGKLSNLEVLDLSYSSFVELPRGIERLIQLKGLDLSGCVSLKVIQPNVITELIHLEKLKMLESHVTWGSEGVSTGERSSASLAELKNLPQLIVLELSVPDFSFLPKDFFSKKWKECKITTNKGSYISFCTPGWNCSSKLELFKLKKREINVVFKCGLQVLLKSSEELVLDGLEDDMDDIVYELDKEGFPQLRELTLKNSGGIRYLVNSVHHSSTAAFVSLERLCLDNLTTLERICHGELIRGSFGQLTSVEVAKCARLKSLFPISVATKLEVLGVDDCEEMEAIFTIEREDDNDLGFTELWSLSLENLPRLVQLCSKLKTTSTSRWKEEPFEEELGISMPLFDAKVQMPNLSLFLLVEIGCKQIWHHLPSPTFYNLETLDVFGCHNFKSLMSYSMVTNLVSLSTLKVKDCENMEEVISTEKEEEKLDLISFNKLDTLKLSNLRSLRRFNAAGAVNFPSLLSMTLVDCFQLTTFVPGSTKAPQRETFFSGEVIVPKLNGLKVNNCKIINEIFNLEGQSCFDKLENLDLDNGKNLHLGKGKAFQDLKFLSIKRCYGLKSLATPSVYFQYLIILEVSECNGLINLFSSSVVKGMVCLREIIIAKCKGITEIIGNDHEGIAENEIVFEQLSDLELHDLPNLRCFYSGNSAITFPNLKNLIVRQCFEMQTFSYGIVNSPFLDRIITEEEEDDDDGHSSNNINIKEQHWDGNFNINSTIQKIYEERRKKSESSSNEQTTSESSSNEDELSPELTELSGGDQVKRDSWKGKEQATKSSSSSSNSAFSKRRSSF